MTFDDLVARARVLAAGDRRAVLGVAGSPGSGKSTLVALLLTELGPDVVAHVPMDGFHLADVELARLGRADRKGAPDTFDVAGYVALLRRLRAGGAGTIYAPAFERDLDQALAGAIAIPPTARLVLTEGNYLLLDEPGWRDVRPELDEAWFCDLSVEVRLTRLTARHVAFGRTPEQAAAWVAAVDEPNAARIENTRARADLVVPSALLQRIG